MTLGRPRRILRGVTAALLFSAAGLGGCAGPRLSADAPGGVSLSGNWRLDRAASDDPQKILDQMRIEARRLMDRQRTAAGADALSAGGRPHPQRGPAGAAGDAGPAAPGDIEEDSGAPPEASAGGAPTRAARPDPLRRSPMAQLVSAAATRGDFLAIRQSAGEITFDYGSAYHRSFTPGSRSVVSAEGGVGDQTSGWKGRDFVVDVRAQIGPDVSERYSLSADGQRLLDVLRISGGELRAVQLKRIYRPASESAPPQVPSTD